MELAVRLGNFVFLSIIVNWGVLAFIVLQYVLLKRQKHGRVLSIHLATYHISV